MDFIKNNSLFIKLVIMVSLALCPPILLSHLAGSYFISKYGFEQAEQTVANVAQLTAESSAVIEGMEEPRGEAWKQMADFLGMLTSVSGVKFIVLIDMNGNRIYHPEAQKIGAHVVGGDEGEALKGKTYISSARGTFGFSQRAFRPVYAENGRQVGAVVVGIMSRDIENNVARLTSPMTWLFGLSLIIGIVLAVLLSRKIKKILFGLEPHQIARMLEERNAILSTVREGIIAINKNSRLVVVNEMAEKILRAAGVKGKLLGQPVQEVVPSTRLDSILRQGKPEYDREQNINGLIIMTNRAPVIIQGKTVGAVATFRDLTEIRVQAERLTGLRNYAEALRSRSHEYLNRLHVISGLLNNRCYAELEGYLADIIGSKVREISSIKANVREPVVVGLLESKFSRANELGVTLSIGGDGIIPPLSSRGGHALVTVLGNLVDNAFDAVSYTDEKHIHLNVHSDAARLVISVSDTGRGVDENHLQKIFNKGFSTKGAGRGIGLYMLLLTLDELDGSVEIDSHVEQGTTFTVSVPLARLMRENCP
ncbi:DcuS/MalK family sensor histidine kinase [Desulfovibrio falkowii]|uniref:DcuS/MalK family sensor histidine kinase n=1 Tax=Desulfovibrio sp. WGS1351 TaxID=3366814 RepID=UPI00372D109D